MKRGFTFIELIIVVAIILVLSIAIIANYNSYTDRERVRQTALTIKSDLRLVGSKVNSGVKSSSCTTLLSYDVTFAASCSGGRACYTITPNCSNGLLSGEQMTVYIPKEVQIQFTVSTIRFLPLSAGTDLTGDATITLSGISTPYYVRISPSGAISDSNEAN
jgi:prepilin-type N-terminal cleavage/methylation domain-containing protein